MEPQTWTVGDEQLVVRRARAGDVPGLAALVGADPISAARGDSGEGDLVDYDRAFAALDADPHQLLVVVTRAGDETPVATMQRTLIPGFTRRGAWRSELEAVHVAGHLRGRGLGQRLVQWAVDEARARGCVLVQLTSLHERHDAHRFYARLGFVASHVGFKLPLS